MSTHVAAAFVCKRLKRGAFDNARCFDNRCRSRSGRDGHGRNRDRRDNNRRDLRQHYSDLSAVFPQNAAGIGNGYGNDVSGRVETNADGALHLRLRGRRGGDGYR